MASKLVGAMFSACVRAEPLICLSVAIAWRSTRSPKALMLRIARSQSVARVSMIDHNAVDSCTYLAEPAP